MHNKSKTNTELLQTMVSALNDRLTTSEPPPQNRQQPEPQGGGLNTFYRRQTFVLDSVVVKS